MTLTPGWRTPFVVLLEGLLHDSMDLSRHIETGRREDR